jgi:ribonuclease HII
MMILIGCDEAGRGPLAGPIVGAAVAFKEPEKWEGFVQDSKQLSALKRERAFRVICNSAYVGYRIIDAADIDYGGIQEANITVLEDSFMQVDKAVSHDIYEEKIGADTIQGIADGNLKLKWNIISEVKADEKYAGVAAASIVAKVLRDHIMMGYDQLFPRYGFAQHFGYYCDDHVNAIRQYGRCLIHRRSFKVKALGEK